MTPGPSNLSLPDIFMILWNWKGQDSWEGEWLKEMWEWFEGQVLPPNQVTFRYARDMKQLFSDWNIKMASSCFRKSVARAKLLSW